MENIKSKIKNIKLKNLHIILIAIGVIFVLLPAFNTNLWFDEAYSVGMANQSFSDIWNIGGNDVHPILYYWALRVVSIITNGSILAFKLFSCIPIIIMSILGYTHIRKDFGEKTGIIFSFLSIFLPEMVLYAAEIRMYSWAILSVTVLAIYAYRLASKDNTKNWIIFGIASLISIYLHYYGLMAAGLINLVLLFHLIKNKRKKGLIFIISFGIVQLLAYIPWMMNFVKQLSQVSNGFWIGFEFPTTLMELIGGQLAGYISLEVPTLLAIILGIYMIYKAIKLHKQKEDLKPFILAISLYLAVIVAALIITLIMWTSILYYRYLFVITGLYIFAISYILGKEKNNVIVCVVLTIIAILGIWNNIIMIQDNYDSRNQEPIEYLESNIQEGDTIVHIEVGSGFVVDVQFEEYKKYFYNGSNWNVEEAYKAFGPNYETTITTDFIDDCSDRVWVIDSANEKTAESILVPAGYTIISEETFETAYHDYSYKITLVQRLEE